MSNFYCKLYIDSDVEKEQLVQEIVLISKGYAWRDTVVATVAELDLEDNEDFSPIYRNNTVDGFLYYRYYADIEPNTAGRFVEKDYVDFIAALIESLWVKNYKVVAACDFEARLPRNGRYDILAPQ